MVRSSQIIEEKLIVSSKSNRNERQYETMGEVLRHHLFRRWGEGASRGSQCCGVRQMTTER